MWTSRDGHFMRQHGFQQQHCLVTALNKDLVAIVLKNLSKCSKPKPCIEHYLEEAVSSTLY